MRFLSPQMMTYAEKTGLTDNITVPPHVGCLGNKPGRKIKRSRADVTTLASHPMTQPIP